MLSAVRVEKSENWNLSDFERGDIVVVRLAGASVTKYATLLGVQRVTISKVTSAYKNKFEDNISIEKEGRKSALAAREKDCFENHRTTAAQVTGQQN
jgi:transposase